MADQLERLVFLDETWLKTNMIKTTGWAPKGECLVDHAPFGHWNTQTFIAALRHDRLDAPWVIPGAINAELFATYVETQLAPTLSPGDVVILDNLPSHNPPPCRTGASRYWSMVPLFVENAPLGPFLIPPICRHTVPTSTR